MFRTFNVSGKELKIGNTGHYTSFHNFDKGEFSQNFPLFENQQKAAIRDKPAKKAASFPQGGLDKVRRQR